MNESTNLLHFVHLDRVPYAILLVLVAYVVVRVAARFTDALGERFVGRRLLFKQAAAIGRFVVLVLTTLAVFGSVFEISSDLLTLGGAALATVIGLAFKDLWASLLAGVVLLFDRPFQVGDRVTMGDTYGEVLDMGLLSVRVVTLDDNQVSIPNNRFLSERVASANSGQLDQMCVFDFFIGCNENYREAKRIVYEATVSSRYVYLNKPITVLMREGAVPDGAERFAIRLTVKAYVLDGRYETAFGTDVHERVKASFRVAGIRTAGEIEWGPGA